MIKESQYRYTNLNASGSVVGVAIIETNPVTLTTTGQCSFSFDEMRDITYFMSIQTSIDTAKVDGYYK